MDKSQQNQGKQGASCLVIGDGAVGTAIASRLIFLNKAPVFVGRRGPVAIKSRFEGWGRITYLDIKALAQADVSNVVAVFVTVKAYDLAGALERYLPYIPKGVPIIPLANGAIEEIVFKVARRFPDYIWRIGLCTFGVTCVSESIYSLRSTSGKAIWGPLERRVSRERINLGNAEPTPVEKQLFEADKGAFFQWQDVVIPAIRRKWLFNVVINSMTAVQALERNGELLNDMTGLSLIFEEAHRLGIELWGQWDKSFDKLFEEMICLISATAGNENSMACDLRLGRRTENDFLAKLALGRRDYPLLAGLALEIEKKTKYKDRRST